MDINLNYKIDNEKTIRKYLQELDDAKVESINRGIKSSGASSSGAISKVNTQLKEITGQLQTAQNEITKNQILQQGLNELRTLLSQYSQSNIHEAKNEIASIINNTQFKNESLLAPITGNQDTYNIQELAKKIEDFSNTAKQNISGLLNNISKANISMENIMASNSQIPSDKFASVNDIIMKIQKDILKSGSNTQANLSKDAVFELTK